MATVIVANTLVVAELLGRPARQGPEPRFVQFRTLSRPEGKLVYINDASEVAIFKE